MVYVNPLPQVLLELAIDRASTIQKSLGDIRRLKSASPVAVALADASRDAVVRLKSDGQQVLQGKTGLTSGQKRDILSVPVCREGASLLKQGS